MLEIQELDLKLIGNEQQALVTDVYQKLVGDKTSVGPEEAARRFELYYDIRWSLFGLGTGNVDEFTDNDIRRLKQSEEIILGEGILNAYELDILKRGLLRDIDPDLY